MHRYPELKDSGVKWIGIIPKHWKSIKLKRILRPVSIKNCPELPLLSIVREIGVIKRDIGDTESNHNFIPDDLSNYKVVKKGQFVINKMKAWQGSYGISDYTGIVSPAYFVFNIAFNNLNYFHYAIRSKVYVNFFAQASDGIRVGQWDLQMDKMKEILFIVPSLPEQEQIARFLDWKTTDIDSLISVRQKQVEKLKELRTSVISSAVTRGLDPSAPMKDSGVKWIGMVPKHWKIIRTKYLGILKNGLTYSPSDVCDESNGTLVLRSSNIQNGQLSFKDNVYVSCKVPSNLMVQNGDILICSRNGSRELVGKSALIEDVNATFGAFMMIYRCKNPQFMRYIFNSSFFTHYMGNFSTSTINQLTKSNFYNMRFPLPPLSEQEEIVKYLDTRTTEIDKLIATYEDEITRLKEFKTSLISDTVTGKIDVRGVRVPESVVQKKEALQCRQT